MIGKTLSHYKVLEKIGQGGMGEVYRAEDTNLSREVAIKVLPEQFTQDPQRLARFEREAKLLASLNHPNIAAIYGLEEADGVRFLALELVPGETLAERVAKGPVPVEEALEVCRQIAEGVEAAHEKGVIHRDLKPANVKVTPEGKVKILDFGLAKAFEDEIPAADISQSPTLTEEMTRAGVILGTAAYMSPEQAKGKPVDKRADIFAFGAVLYELLTGKRAFEGETITETLGAIIHKEPDWATLPESTPSIIQVLLRQCLQKDPDSRLRDIADFQALSEATLAPVEPISAAQPVQQRWGMTVGLVVLGAVVTGLSVWFLIQPSSPEQRLNKFVVTPSPSGVLADTTGNEVAVSPDGRHLVYSGIGEGGATQVYLRSVDDFLGKLIPGTEGSEEGSPFFSPNGEFVAFFARNELRKVSLTGGLPITLCDVLGPVSSGSWGPDDTIIFGSSSGSGLYQVSALGGEPEVLATPDLDKGEFSYSDPHFLPGGEAILFSVFLGPTSQIRLMFLETGEQKILIEGGGQANYVETGHLVYEQNATGILMAVAFDFATLEVTSSPVPVLQGVRQSIPGRADYALSEDGTLAYVPQQRTVQSLVWTDRKGTESLIIQEELGFGSPRISPDGTQVAVAIADEDGQNIWIFDFESESFRRLTFVSGSVEEWSPDGRWIIYQRVDEENRRTISRRLADGSGTVEHFTSPAAAQMPGSLTPDGGVLAFSKSGRTLDIWMLPMEGDSEPQPFITSINLECCPKFSPDGKWLA
jgi:serine/threonine-protein kinase